jgi:DedD protein
MEEDDDESPERDREMTLGTSVIIGIFFGLILICAIFFAFGYSLGRRSALPATGVAAPAASQDTGSSSTKPSSGVPASQSASSNSDSSTDDSSSNQSDAPAAIPTPVAVPVKRTIKPPPVSRAAAPVLPATVYGTGHLVVQVAAVSRKSDADMLMSALKRHGYNAAIHQSSQDKLLHVQIGPFASKQDADGMRQKLIGDGYNAIVK